MINFNKYTATLLVKIGIIGDPIWVYQRHWLNLKISNKLFTELKLILNDLTLTAIKGRKNIWKN